jgi:uracil-DNA glycosylase family 4
MAETLVESKVGRKHPLAKCESCPLYNQGFAPSQFPTGGKSKYAIVSRSPGFHDTMAGKPFAGPSGDVLNHLLKQNGVKREEVYISNVVLCSPPEGKVPTAAIEACNPRLTQELLDCRADTILAAGAEAVNSLIGRQSIDYYRGRRIKRGSKVFVATNNPALVLRDDSTFPNLVKDFRRTFNPTPAPKMPKVLLATEEKVALEILSHIESQHDTYVAADIESRGGLSHKAELVSLQFALSGNEAYVIGEPTVRAGAVVERLRKLFSRTDLAFIWHNGIFDTKILRHGYDIPARVDEDTLLLSWACDERGGKDGEGSYHTLEYLLMEEFSWPDYVPASVKSFKKTGRLVSETEEKELRKKWKRQLDDLDTVGFDREFKELEKTNYIALYKYGGYDAAGTFQLFELLSDRAKSDSVFDKPYRQTLLAAEDALREMETTGMPYDFNRAAEMLEKIVNPELEQIKVDLRELTGKELLNPASHTQMAVVYYDDFQVSHAMRDRPDKKRSVDESARKEITDNRFHFAGEWTAIQKGAMLVREESPDAQKTRNLIKQVATQHDRFQKLHKQATNYLEGLIRRAEVDPESRIYTTLPRHATSTGRLASRGPNLQNVTRTKEGLPDIRGLFYASPGTLLVQADYSQAELRTIAALSGARFLTKIYEEGQDLHNILAERFYGPDFTSEQRSNSKNMNFGVFYWQSAETFQEKHEIPKDKAQEYIDWIWKTFPDVKEWQKEVTDSIHTNKCRDYTFVASPFGHRRRFYLITRENKNAIYREAINFLPQNIAANLTLHACIQLHKEVDRKQARLCLTVHDSILAQVVESYVEEYKTICNQVMEAMPHDKLGWTLPFKADIGEGRTWATAK